MTQAQAEGADGTPTAAELAAQARDLVLRRFDLADAVALGRIATARAEAAGLAVVIEVDHLGRLAYRVALPGSRPDSDDWIARKRRVVTRFGRATLALRRTYEERGTTFAAATGLPEHEYAAHGGGVPVEVAGVGIVGAIYASGLPDVEDHGLCVSSLRELADPDRP